MDLQSVYNSNKKTIIGSDLEYIKNFQKKLIHNYVLDKNVLNHNESTKHIDKKIIKSINYFIKDSKPKIQIQKNNKLLTSSIIVKNGNDYLLHNIDDENIIFDSLYNKKDLMIEKINKYKDTFVDDYVVNLNSIFFNSSFDLYLRENSNSKIDLLHLIDAKKSTIYAKNFFKINKNTKLLLIERFENHLESNSNIVNYFEVEAGSEVMHLIIQNNSVNADLQFSSHINCHASSTFKQFTFNVSQASIRNHHYANLIGQNGKVDLQGIFFAAKNQIVDNKTLINHLSPDCTSNQTYKAILTDNAKASYLSKTFVDRKAQKTEGYQLSKGILLSRDSYFHSKPELKIYANDVKCSHGSTIGPFDDDMLFYLRTRGLDLNQAKSFLIKSFCMSLLDNIEEKTYKIEAIKLADKWLKKNSF